MEGKKTSKQGINERQIERDWKAIISFLPEGWKEKAKELGALSRNRNFTTAEMLLRVLLIHIDTNPTISEPVFIIVEAGD